MLGPEHSKEPSLVEWVAGITRQRHSAPPVRMAEAGAGAAEGYESVDAAEGPTTFGSRPFSADELHRIQQGLMKKLPRSCLSERSAGSGGKVSYIEGHRVIDHANQVLGFDGWSSSLLSLTQDYVRAHGRAPRPTRPTIGTNAHVSPLPALQCDLKNERYSLCFTAIVRVQLKDGTFHEDVGCGLSEGQRSRGQALEKAKKVRAPAPAPGVASRASRTWPRRKRSPTPPNAPCATLATT